MTRPAHSCVQPCLWDGCSRGAANPIAVSRFYKGKWVVGGSVCDMRKHEVGHTKGDAPRGFVCPADGCDFVRPTSAAVWAHAEEAHGVCAARAAVSHVPPLSHVACDAGLGWRPRRVRARTSRTHIRWCEVRALSHAP